MATPHIEAKENDFAKIVLMPGDPKRAKWIADNFLTDVRLVSAVRGILAFTGKTKGGAPVSVMASGMGMPSIGIYSHELFSCYGVEAIVRIGTMGTYQPEVKVKDVIIAEGACTDSNWMSQFHLGGGTFSAIADFGLLEKAVAAAREKNIPCHVGNILSADVFYDADQGLWKKWAGLGVLGVEMESYALYAEAARQNKKALTICTVSDSFVDKSRELSSEERQEGLVQMVEVALRLAEKWNGCPKK